MTLQINKTVNKNISSYWYYLLKYIAMLSMVFDHVGYVFITNDTFKIYFRTIGRIAFPLFAYEIVSCYYFSNNHKKHLKELFYLAIISEIPFDIAFIITEKYSISNIKQIFLSAISYQNVIFTLFLGYIMLILINENWEEIFDKIKLFKFEKIKKIYVFLTPYIIWAIFLVLSELLKTDYGARGITLIALFDFSRKRKNTFLFQVISLICFIYSGYVALSTFSLIIIFFISLLLWMAETNNRQEISNKKEWYKNKFIILLGRYFYPLHIIIIAILKLLLIT